MPAGQLGLLRECSQSRAPRPFSEYSVQVPGGLVFAEFRGYEGWETVAISRTEEPEADVTAEPCRIGAERAGAHGNGQAFPDGAEVGNVRRGPEKNEYFPDTTGPGTLRDVDVRAKASKRFADSGGWDGPCL